MSGFARRFRFYLTGFAIGLFLVFIFFGKRATQCSYFPNSRTLEEAKVYPIIFADEVQNEGIDSLFLYNELFVKSKITNFGTEEVRATPCRIYHAEYREEIAYDFEFQICDKKETRITALKKIVE